VGICRHGGQADIGGGVVVGAARLAGAEAGDSLIIFNLLLGVPQEQGGLCEKNHALRSERP